ncbi:MAG: hypothetical protein NT158_01765 [Cyanobacteria bacterium]|nr:hypothetical protein [Cyanobacteriota bacterium]
MPNLLPRTWSLRLLLPGLVLFLGLWLGAPARAQALEMQLSEVTVAPCPVEDVGSQPQLRRPSGAACYALRGQVSNNSSRTVRDTDVFALILDASGEPVLPNRTRLGSIGDIPPGQSPFALRLAVPAGTPGPFTVRSAKARGFNSPVRTGAAPGQELLPLEEALIP